MIGFCQRPFLTFTLTFTFTFITNIPTSPNLDLARIESSRRGAFAVDGRSNRDPKTAPSKCVHAWPEVVWGVADKTGPYLTLYRTVFDDPGHFGKLSMPSFQRPPICRGDSLAIVSYDPIEHRFLATPIATIYGLVGPSTQLAVTNPYSMVSR